MDTMVADTFVSRHGHVFTAIASVVAAIVLATIANRVMAHREERRSAAAGLIGISDTRLRILRRFVAATILLAGIFIGLTQFDAVDRAASAVLASGAIAAAILGFAARQTLANAIAGLMIAWSQPLRLGDVVTIEGETGTVEDVRLTYTFLRTAEDIRVVVPNERLATSILRNASLVSPSVGVRASLWLPRDADAGAVLRTLERALPDCAPRIAEVAVEGIRVELSGQATTVAGRDAAQSAVLSEALGALRAAGV